jgi:hypothetical protein
MKDTGMNKGGYNTQKKEICPYLLFCIKINSKWIKGKLRENMGRCRHRIYCTTPVLQEIKE